MSASQFFFLAARAVKRAEAARDMGDNEAWRRWTEAGDFWLFCAERWW